MRYAWPAARSRNHPLAYLSHLPVARSRAALDEIDSRFRRIAGERLPRRKALFFRWPRKDRIAKKSLQFAERRRIAELTERADGFHAQRSARSEHVVSLHDAQQRPDAFSNSGAADERHRCLRDFRIGIQNHVLEQFERN